MSMRLLFHNLLVSAPNSGAFFVLRHGVAYRLDSLGTTGVHAIAGTVYRGVQPCTLKIYGQQVANIGGLGGALDDIHDVAVLDDRLFVVGTERNEVVRLSLAGEIEQRWTLPGERDSSHLNCIAKWGTRIVYSCFGDFQTHRGYKSNTLERGLVRDLCSGEILISGLSQPHSPTQCGENLLLANSGLQEIREYNPHGTLVRAKKLGAYTRGLALRDGVLYVGLSSPRPGNDPVLTDYCSQLLALDKDSWEEIARIELSVGEIYSVVPVADGEVLDSLIQIAADNETIRAAEHSRRRQLEAERSEIDARITELVKEKTIVATQLQEIRSTWLWPALNFMLGQHEPQRPTQRLSETVDVIVPVYRGLQETRACIESLLANRQKVSHEIVVINDASPEAGMSEWLDEVGKSGAITVLHNPVNLGFVGTVNRGMGLHPDRDVVLLNSDTVVANDWLDRLLAQAYQDPTTATVTPFSNNATICSFPDFCKDNEVTPASAASLDILCKALFRGKNVDIPTAVGFCMFIKRAALCQVGDFDVEAFGKGYGEENDFCMRASSQGWKHKHCLDTFVYHAGATSFASSHNSRVEAAIKKLHERYPNYQSIINKFVAEDPAKGFRITLSLLSMSQRRKPIAVAVYHNMGGGTRRHVLELSKHLAAEVNFVGLTPIDEHTVRLNIPLEAESNDLFFDVSSGYGELRKLLKSVGVARVHFHHTYGLSPAIWNLAKDLQVPYDFTFHDYYPICPQISLSDHNHRYCGEPDERGCNQCLQIRPAPGNPDIATWRSNKRYLIENADRVFAPSTFVGERVRRHFRRARLLIADHPNAERFMEAGTFEVNPITEKSDSKLRVCVIGALSKIKGADLLESCALDALSRRLPIEFHLIGYSYKNLSIPNITVTGIYRDEELQKLIQDSKCDLIWFPAQWPETYSYTLDAAFESGLPIVTTDLGAVAERVEGRPYSWIKSWKARPSEWNDFFMELPKESELAPSSWVPSWKPYRYSTEYLAPLSNLLPPETELASIEFIVRRALKARRRRLPLHQRALYKAALRAYHSRPFQRLMRLPHAEKARASMVHGVKRTIEWVYQGRSQRA